MKDLLIFIVRCIELKEKLILKFIASRQINLIFFFSFFFSRLFLTNVVRGLEMNLILQEIKLVTTSQRVTSKEIYLASQRAATKDRDNARYFSKRSSKVNRVLGNAAGSKFVYSDLDKNKCDPEYSKVVTKSAKILSTVTRQLVSVW